MNIKGKHYLTIWHDQNKDIVKIIDQTKLPFNFEIKDLRSYQDGFDAIKNMLVRGAPLIGATAAYSLYLGGEMLQKMWMQPIFRSMFHQANHHHNCKITLLFSAFYHLCTISENCV